jgi:hypothetical protein
MQTGKDRAPLQGWNHGSSVTQGVALGYISDGPLGRMRRREKVAGSFECGGSEIGGLMTTSEEF